MELGFGERNIVLDCEKDKLVELALLLGEEGTSCGIGFRVRGTRWAGIEEEIQGTGIGLKVREVEEVDVGGAVSDA